MAQFPTTPGLNAVIDKVEALLKGYAPTFRTKADVDRHSSPPRYVWYAGDEVYGPPIVSGQNPRRLYESITPCEVHIWGKSANDCEQMRDAVITATRQQLGPLQFEPKGGRWVPVGTNQLGVCLVITLEIRLGVMEMATPAGRLLARKGQRVATVTGAAIIPPATPPTDGELAAGETP